METTTQTPDEPQSVEAWCKEYCPTLPTKIRAIVDEWNLRDGPNQHKWAVLLILTAVKDSVNAT